MEFLYNESIVKESTNITDRWVLSSMQSLIRFFETEMAGASLLGCPPGIRTLLLFIITLLRVSFFFINTEEIIERF